MKDLENQLKNITNQIENEVNEEVSLGELFDRGFLEKNSEFETLNEFFKFHDILVTTLEDFEALKTEVLDEAVKLSTSFNSWDEMLQEAEEERIMKKLKM